MAGETILLVLSVLAFAPASISVFSIIPIDILSHNKLKSRGFKGAPSLAPTNYVASLWERRFTLTTLHVRGFCLKLVLMLGDGIEIQYAFLVKGMTLLLHYPVVFDPSFPQTLSGNQNTKDLDARQKTSGMTENILIRSPFTVNSAWN